MFHNLLKKSFQILLPISLLLLHSFPVMAMEKGAEGVSSFAPAPEMDVIYHVKGNKLFLEFHLRHFRLTKEQMGKKKVYGEGHIHLFIDGKKVAKIFKSVHVESHLPPGKHTVKVELTHNNHEPYGIERVFPIEVK
ncbi:hypothetical protein [Thermicanus aegyptius]|uniref:hypothetical protein n=1 Tax=Thermicanus aegyptius TaxID=94009 RepID=UPI000411BE24|nr:hypothetical protein [Thermicanus aegyptius]